jgi:mono/diheme cytochrome c family protein
MDSTTSLGIFIGALVLLFLVRKHIALFWTATGFYGIMMAYLKLGFDPPVPASVIVMYSVTLIVAVLLYVSSSEAGRQAFFGPIVSMITEKRLTLVRVFVLVAIPGLLAWQGFQASAPDSTAPPKIRSVHPSPPNSVKFHGFGEDTGRVVDLVKEDNPLRAYQESDPEKYKEKVELGKKIYYQNCYYCHGDHLMADGHYAKAVNPPPANFQDAGTIAMLQETFIFWRVAKGGPGLPDAGTPWDSSMPVWEKFLTEDEIWSVIAFMYDHTGYKPRGKENLAEQH